jgi:mRNA interferase MazF
VVQAQALLDAGHPSTLVIPLTTNLAEDAEPLRVRVPRGGKLTRDSDALIDHVRSVDDRRLVRGPLAKLSADHMSRIDAALHEVLDLGAPTSSP